MEIDKFIDDMKKKIKINKYTRLHDVKQQNVP